MITPLVLVAIMVAVPVLLLLVLRINAAIVFLSLCLGDVLVQFASKDAGSFVNLFSGSEAARTYGTSLALLLIPAVFTMIVMIGTVRSKFRLLLNVLPAAATGFLGVLLAEPLFAPGLRSAIANTQAWHNMQQLQVLIVSAGTIVSLLFLWLQRPGREGGKRGRH
jgi:hypothetical protein